MNLKNFYDVVRKTITLTPENVRGFDFIIAEGQKRKVPLHDLAYILATTFHETAHRMQPIAEYGKGKGRKYGVKGRYGQIPYGRGYVQLTWDDNYERADKELGLGGALLKDFDLALKTTVAVQILFVGMEEGWFTGKKLRDFIDTIDEDDAEDGREFQEARRIINGVDKKVLIASYALLFEKALKAAEYSVSEKQTTLPDKPIINTDDPGVEAPKEPAKKITLWDIISIIIDAIRGK